MFRRFDDRRTQEDYVDELLTKLITWARDQAPPWFDESFIHDCFIKFHDSTTKSISARQVAALENIAEKFKVK